MKKCGTVWVHIVWYDSYVKCIVKFKLRRFNKFGIFAFHLLQLSVINKGINVNITGILLFFVTGSET